MCASLSWLLCALCVGIAVGQTQQDRAVGRLEGQPAPVAETPGEWQVVKTIFAQPAVEASAVDDRVIGDSRPVGGEFLVRLANVGEDADTAAIAWDVGRYTGFRPGASESLSLFQRGPRQAAEGTAVQLRGTEIGIWIDSDHPRPRRGALIPVCPPSGGGT